MQSHKSYKVELDPNNTQKSEIRKNFGAARYGFNFALDAKKKCMDQNEDSGKKEKIPSNITLHKELNKIKGSDILPWAYEVSKCSFQNALRDCDEAFKHFFRRCKIKDDKPKGFPKFKSKHNDRQSCRLEGAIKVLDRHIQLPRLGKIRIKETNYLPIDSHIISATISHKAGRFFVSLNVREEAELPPVNHRVVGIDLGIKTLATLSSGKIFENPRALSRNLKSLKRIQRRHSRKKKGSQNRKKHKLKLQKKHVNISNIRKDSLHKATSSIINENQVIILEDLKVANMVKNRKLSRAISDVGFYEFRRQIEYKAIWSGREVYLADTFYPSSKTCSSCGNKKDISLNDRVYNCDKCSLEIDRDLNASLNLKQLYTVSSTGIHASGDGSSIEHLTCLVQPVVERGNKLKVS